MDKQEWSARSRAARRALLAGSALGCSVLILAVAGPEAARADNECGAITANAAPASDLVVCTSASGTGNPYSAGINYYEAIDAATPNDLTVIVAGGGALAAVNQLGGSGSGGVFLGGTPGNNATLTTYSGAKLAGTTGGQVSSYSGGAAVIVNAAAVYGGALGLIANGSGVSGGGTNSTASITNTGAITVNGVSPVVGSINPVFAIGALAQSSGGAASVVNSAAVSVTGGGQTLAAGLMATSLGAVSVTNQVGGAVVVNGQNQAVGLLAGYSLGSSRPTSATAVNGGTVTVVSAGGASASVPVGAGQLPKYAAAGIVASGNTASVDLQNGTITATGPGAFGVYAYASSGDLTVISGASSTITANGVGSAGAGLRGSAPLGAATVVVNNVYTTGADTPGVAVSGAGAVSVTGNIIQTTGDNSAGVSATSTASTATANLTQVSTQGQSSPGVIVSGATGAYATVKSVSTLGDSSTGVQVSSATGPVTATVGGATTAGVGATGVSARSLDPTSAGTVQVDVGYVSGATSLGVSTTGQGANAVYASSVGGAIAVTNHNFITTTGAGSNAVYATSGAGAISLTNLAGSQVTTSGAGAAGLSAKSTSGAVTVTNAGSVVTQGNGAVGIYAVASSGGATATVASSGAVTTAGASSTGIIAKGDGGATVTLDGSVTTAAATALGVQAISANGAAAVTGAGSVTTTGALSHGVYASGSTSVTVGLRGAVSATGAASYGVQTTTAGTSTVNAYTVTAYADAVHAVGGAGSTVTVAGPVTSSNGAGVWTTASAGSATVTVASGASVTGATYGVYASGAAGASLDNHGKVQSTGATAVILLSSTGTAALTNETDGVIVGAVNVQGLAGSTVTNAGAWKMSGDSTIGTAGSGGVLTNSGTIQLAPGAVTPQTVTIANLATFNTSGLIDLRNGQVGDVFTLSQTAFNASTGSRLAVDASLKGALGVDELIVGAVTGKTTVTVNDLSPSSAGVIDLVGAPVVKAASGAAGDFVLAGGVVQKGFVDYALLYDPTTVTWNLVGLPGHAVFESLKVAQAVEDYTSRSTDLWSWRMQTVRDQVKRKDGPEVWGQVYGGVQNRSDSSGFTAGGFSFAQNLSARAAWGGVQVGVDDVLTILGGKAIFGVTGGYLQQSTRFAQGGDQASGGGLNGYTAPVGLQDSLNLNGANVGLYAGWRRWGLFANALVKADFASVDVKLPSAAAEAHTHAKPLSATGEIGWRIDTPRFYVEPVVSVTDGESKIDRWTVPGASATYPDVNVLKGSAGARVGGVLDFGALAVNPYLGVYATGDLSGHNAMDFATGLSGVTLQDRLARPYGRVELGVSTHPWKGLEGFAKIEGDFAGGVTGVNGDIGVRWRF
jgi:hypothetical protein